MGSDYTSRCPHCGELNDFEGNGLIKLYAGDSKDHYVGCLSCGREYRFEVCISIQVKKAGE